MMSVFSRALDQGVRRCCGAVAILRCFLGGCLRFARLVAVALLQSRRENFLSAKSGQPPTWRWLGQISKET